MDPATLTIGAIASAIVSALVPFLKKGGETLANEVAKEGFAQRGEIWQTVKGLFVEDDLTTLDLFADNPEDAKIQGKLEGKLEERLKNQPEIAKELEKLLTELKETGSTQIINENVSDSEIRNRLKRNAENTGKAGIANTEIARSKIDNDIEIS